MEGLLVIVLVVIVLALLGKRAENKEQIATRPSPPTPSKVESSKPLPSRAKVVNAQDVEINDDFRFAFDLIEHKNASIFITGRAGTGKSTFLRYFRSTTRKNVVVLAPTGLAAVNVGGQTIHSFFRFPPRLIDTSDLRPNRNSTLFRKLAAVVIDEVSMVRADMMDAIDTSLRLNRGRPNEPFGGVQVIMIGDLFQLPPVVKEKEVKDYLVQKYGGSYFFRAPVFAVNKFPVIELQKVYRQTDATFINLLNCIRDQRLDGGVLESLNKQVCALNDSNSNIEYITLTPTNEAANQINMTRLENLSSPKYTFEAIVSGQFDSSSFPTESPLPLKVGAPVMMIRNDTNKRWVNGTLGVVNKVGPEVLDVMIGGTTHKVERHTWENVKYVYNAQEGRIQPSIIGTFQQYPLRLAWALTIHKSQGLTLDRVNLDLEAGAFTHGQTYVALSRCRSLEGISLKRPVYQTDIIFDKAIFDYRRVFSPVTPGVVVTTGSNLSPFPDAQKAKEGDSLGHEPDRINITNLRPTILRAYSEKHCLQIEYTRPGSISRQAETTSRQIEIYAVGEDYLDAFCRLRRERRTFKVERIVSARIMQSSYEIPIDYIPSTWVTEGTGIVDSNKS